MGETLIRRENEEVPVFIKLNPFGIAAVERLWRIKLYTRCNDG
jgi:hypothetical protein